METPAEQLLKSLGVTEPAEIDLEAIAWDRGVRVRYRPLFQCEARIIGTKESAVITVNTRSPHRRQRFSIAHELGHWHHHRGRTLMCTDEDIGRAAPADENPEREADRFAGSLLMPDYLFRPIANTYQRIDTETIRALSDSFDTSNTAAAIKLFEGNYILGCLVCHGLNGRKWFTRSPDVPSRWFPAKELSADSFAFEMLFQRAREQKFPRKIGAGAWFDRSDADKYEVREQTIRTGSDEILTLILIEDEDMLEEWE